MSRLMFFFNVHKGVVTCEIIDWLFWTNFPLDGDASAQVVDAFHIFLTITQTKTAFRTCTNVKYKMCQMLERPTGSSNSLLTGLPACTLQPLHLIQKTTARFGQTVKI